MWLSLMLDILFRTIAIFMFYTVCFNEMIYTILCLSINFSAPVFAGNKGMENKQVKPPAYLHWPHMQADQVHGLGLREIGGGFIKHHRAPSIRAACYAIAKPSTMVQKMETIKQIRGHRDAVYCGTVALSTKIVKKIYLLSVYYL